MKEFVVGSPYTTETTLGPEDDYLIIACDGVRCRLLVSSLELSMNLMHSYGTYVKIKKQSTSFPNLE